MTRTYIRQLILKAGQRPALLVALAVFPALALFCCGHYLFGVVVVALIAALTLIAYLLDVRVVGTAMLMAMTAAVLLSSPVLNYAANGMSAPVGPGKYEIRVTSVQARLDGKRRIYGLTGSGAMVASVLPEGAEACYPSDIIVIEGDMELPSLAANPGIFDYRSYLMRRGVSRSIVPFEVKVVSRTSGIGSFVSSVASFAEEKRFAFIDSVTSGMDSDTKALACALLFGDRSLMSDDMSRTFTLTGINHLAAVSGTHFAGFLMLFPYLMSLSGIKNRRITGLIYLVCCVFIGFLTSWTESVTRAAFMNVSSFFGRDSLSSMSIAALILMISDPYSVVSQGFLMSYAATLAIRFVVPRIEDKAVALIMSLVKSYSRKGINARRTELRLRKIVSVFAACAGCSLIFCLFADSVEIRVGPVMILINVVSTFMVSGICACFMPMACVMGVWILIAHEAGPMQIPLSFMIAVLKSFILSVSNASYSSFSISSGPQYLIACTVILVVLILLPRSLVKKLLFRAACCSLCLSIGIYSADLVKYGSARIIFVDVGQGDCALVMSGGKTALIDGGVAQEGIDTLPYVLDHFNIRKVDYAIMSHWDLDHVGGLLMLYSQGRVERLYSPYTVCDEQVTEVLTESLGLPPDSCIAFVSNNITGICAGDSFVLSDHCRLNVIYPALAQSGENEDSSVIELDSCGTKILFTGDIGSETESLLADAGLLSDIDILKVAHHGSRFSTCAEFLSAVSAENAVISVAARNSYGHPAPAVLSRLDEAGCRVYRTSLSGAVTVDIGLFGYRVSEFVKSRGEGSG